jgi:hypothetical protein
VATAGLAEDQLTALLMAFAGLIVAVRVSVAPTTRLALVLFRLIPLTPPALNPLSSGSSIAPPSGSQLIESAAQAHTINSFRIMSVSLLSQLIKYAQREFPVRRPGVHAQGIGDIDKPEKLYSARGIKARAVFAYRLVRELIVRHRVPRPSPDIGRNRSAEKRKKEIVVYIGIKRPVAFRIVVAGKAANVAAKLEK